MSCQRCEIDYMQDKVNVLWTCLARITNIMTYSEQSDEVLRANHANSKDLADFKARWPKKCEHPALISTEVQRISPAELREAIRGTENATKTDETEPEEPEQPVIPQKRRPGRPRKIRD